MREYEHIATEETLNAVRHLAGAWRGWVATPTEVRVQTTDLVVVCIGVDRCAKETRFEVRRLAAAFERDVARPLPEVPGFGKGSNDVMVFQGESWLTALSSPGAAARDAWDDDADPERGWLVTHGNPGQRPEGASASCTTTDAVLVVNPHGAGWLVRLGEAPDTLEVTTDRGEISAFMEGRGYAAL